MNLEDFKEQVLPLKNKLYRFSLRIVGRPDEAEDVIQEVFIKLWNTRHQMDQYRSIEAWSIALTKNLSIDKLRSKHRRVEALPQTLGLVSKSATPYKAAERADTMCMIRSFISKLPDKQKMVIQLRDIEGHTYQEITEILDIPLNQVKVNLFRARKAIRAQLINKESYGI